MPTARRKTGCFNNRRQFRLYLLKEFRFTSLCSRNQALYTERSDIFRYPFLDEFQRSGWVRLGYVHSWNGMAELSNGASEGHPYLCKLH
jgi:hypothetical protein